MVESTGVSGYEMTVGELITDVFRPIADEIRTDKLGNVIAKLNGEGTGTHPKIMLAGHMDEIGLMVQKIDDQGFIKFTTVGGVDQRTLLSQEVVVHGRRDLIGIIGAKPPHLQRPSDRDKAVKREDMVIDIGMPAKEARELVEVGDLITIRRRMAELKGDWLAGKAMDDRAGVAVIYECFLELKKLKHTADVYGVATVQEEVGMRGATTSTYGILPEIGIAIDVCHGDMPGVSEMDTAPVGKGPTIALGPNIHPKVYERLCKVAQEYGIGFQSDPSPGGTGTDAWAIQITQAGIATGLLSIPLRYMHTSVETLSLGDVKKAGRLLAHFIASIDSEFVGGLVCC